LLSNSYLPISNVANYQRSHDTADFPAWHGHWMVALALKLAVEPSDEVKLLLYKSVSGIQASFDVTGIDGLLPRSYIKHDSDQPLPWMKLEDQRPTMYWQKGNNGYWFRNGVAKGHYSRTILGLATIIGLHNHGDIKLSSEMRILVSQTFLKIAHYLIENKYKIIDVDGKVTEFGRLDRWYSGFGRLIILSMLRTGKAIGCSRCKKEYERIVKYGAGLVIAITLGLLGTVYAMIGRENALGHFSDDEVVYSSALAFYLNSNTDDKMLKYIRFALRNMWKFLRFSQKSYLTFVYHIIIGVSPKELNQALDTLKWFPDDKRIINNRITTQTHEVQPICNQYISNNYWKSDYFRKTVLTEKSKRVNVQRSAQDYLSAYWLGRYFNLI
jgi:hypothetical protein